MAACSASMAKPFSASQRRRISGLLAGTITSCTALLRTHGAACRMSQMVIPLMPASTTASTSPGCTPKRPSANRHSTSGPQPVFSTKARAFASGLLRRSLAITRLARPLWARYTESLPWSQPTSATRLPGVTSAATACRRGSNCSGISR